MKTFLKITLVFLVFAVIGLPIALFPIQTKALAQQATQTPQDTPAANATIPQDPTIVWNGVLNISQSPDETSTDPFVLADPEGRMHLFWAEKTSNSGVDQADTLMYAYWDGEFWSKPVDIFTTQAVNPLIAFPQAILDDQGIIHLIWMDQPKFPAQTIFYSHVPADQASSAQAWSKPVSLSDDLTGTKNSFSLAYVAPDTLNLIFAKVQAGDNPPSLRSVAYIRSTDRGKSWSDPEILYTVPDQQGGASDTRLLAVGPDKLYATWTIWAADGNGQRIFFTRSSDAGHTWSEPTIIAQRRPGDYETDWNNLTSLVDDTLVTVWEGGYRAYRQFQYSYDNGTTWSEPKDTFPWLIGENGPVEFVRDSLNRLYLFISQRIREGNENKGDYFGLFYSIWQGGENWREPELVGGSNPMLNPKVAIMNGNKIAVAWFSSSLREVMVITGTIEDAPSTPQVIWPTPLPTESAAEEQTATVTAEVPLATVTPITLPTQDLASSPSDASPGLPIVAGTIPALVLLFIFAVIIIRNRK